MNGNYLSSLLFLIVSALGAVYLAVEAVLQSLGSSICAGEGCRIVAQYSRFGDLPIVLAGFAALVLLAVLAGRGMRSESRLRDEVMNLLLVAFLAAEGFFAGYQLFWIGRLCVFCLSVFCIFVALGLLRTAAGHRVVLAGFGALAAVLALFLLLLPPGGAPLSQKQRHLLYFSPDCKHCAEIKADLDAAGIEYASVQAREQASLLRSLGIDEVPTLLVNDPYEKVFLTGTKAIRRYIASYKPEPAAPSGKQRRVPAGSSTTPPAKAPELDLLAPLVPPGALLQDTGDDGICKEDVKCD